MDSCPAKDRPKAVASGGLLCLAGDECNLGPVVGDGCSIGQGDGD